MGQLLGCGKRAACLLFFSFFVVSCFGSQQQQELEDLQIAQQQGGQEQANQVDEDSSDNELSENFGDEDENIGENFNDDEQISNNLNESDGLSNIANEGNDSENDVAGGFADNLGTDNFGGEQFGNDVGFGGQAAVANGAAVEAAPVEGGGVFSGVAGKPAAPGLPEIGSKMVYIVQKGDTLGRISRSIYGDTGRWKQMAEWSGIADPDRIYPGDVVYYQLNEASLAFATSYEEPQPEIQVTVQEGDTLGKIAKRVYGSTSYWQMVWRHNSQISHPDHLEVGMKLTFRGSEIADLRTFSPAGRVIAESTQGDGVVAQIGENV